MMETAKGGSLWSRSEQQALKNVAIAYVDQRLINPLLFRALILGALLESLLRGRGLLTRGIQ